MLPTRSPTLSEPTPHPDPATSGGRRVYVAADPTRGWIILARSGSERLRTRLRCARRAYTILLVNPGHTRSRHRQRSRQGGRSRNPWLEPKSCHFAINLTAGASSGRCKPPTPRWLSEALSAAAAGQEPPATASGKGERSRCARLGREAGRGPRQGGRIPARPSPSEPFRTDAEAVRSRS